MQINSPRHSLLIRSARGQDAQTAQLVKHSSSTSSDY